MTDLEKVCEEAKYEAAELVAAAKQLSAVNEELANLRKKKEDIVDQKKKNKLRALIFECKKRRDAVSVQPIKLPFRHPQCHSSYAAPHWYPILYFHI
jgi:predicted  nucleic acid-binding Zn-ribbon protein